MLILTAKTAIIMCGILAIVFSVALILIACIFGIKSEKDFLNNNDKN